MSDRPSMRGYIDLAKIKDEHVFKKDGKEWLNLTFWATPDDKYGNDYRIDQDVGAEEREKGNRGAILGNAKINVKHPGQQVSQRPEN